MLGPLLPRVSETFGLGFMARGVLYWAQLGGYLVAILCSGIISDKFGRRGVTVTGIAAFMLGTAGFAVSGHLVWALLALVLLGLGSGAINVGASGLFADLHPDRRGFALNLSRIFPTLGSMLVPALTAVTDWLSLTWRSIFMGMAGLTAVGWAVLGRRPFPPANVGYRFAWSDVRALFGNRGFLLLWLAAALAVGGEIGYWSWLITYVTEVRSTSMALGNVMFSLFWVAMLVGRLIGPWLAGRVGDVPLVGWSLAGTAAGMLLTAWAPSPAAQLAAAVWTGLAVAPAFPCLISYAGSLYPSVTGTVVSTLLTSIALGGMIVPSAMGAGAEVIGMQGSYTLVPPITLALGLLAWWAALRRQGAAA